MKKSIIFGALTIMVLGASAACSTASNKEANTCSMAREAATQSIEAEHDGMSFSSLYVVDNLSYSYNDCEDMVYYVVYDDVDAGLSFEPIRVSQTTYLEVLDCLENGKEMCGTLKATREYENVVYEFQPED